MAAEQSQFSKLPKKQLFIIAEKLIDDDFTTDNPYNNGYEDTYEILNNIGKYFNITVNYEDVEFFSKFLSINDNIPAEPLDNPKDKSLIERLEIPVAETYELHYTTWGSCTYTQYLAQKFDSYDKNWVRDSAKQQRQDGNWDYYNGRNVRDTEYENFEESDSSYDHVYEVEDEKPTKESMLDRLVIENTKDVVNSLDKKTLMELRRIIDSKLRLL
jgi:hypothetical protein